MQNSNFKIRSFIKKINDRIDSAQDLSVPKRAIMRQDNNKTGLLARTTPPKNSKGVGLGITPEGPEDFVGKVASYVASIRKFRTGLKSNDS